MTAAEKRTPGGNRADADQQDIEPLHFATERKRRATLTALLAIRGYELRELGGGEYLVIRWRLVRFLSSLDAVESFARTVGAVR